MGDGCHQCYSYLLVGAVHAATPTRTQAATCHDVSTYVHTQTQREGHLHAHSICHEVGNVAVSIDVTMCSHTAQVSTTVHPRARPAHTYVKPASWIRCASAGSFSWLLAAPHTMVSDLMVVGPHGIARVRLVET